MAGKYLCPNCNTEVDDTDAVCPVCGYDFSSQRVSVRPGRSGAVTVGRGSGTKGSRCGKVFLILVGLTVAVLAVIEFIGMPDLDGENPAWSPDGRLLAFVREGEIYLADRDSDEERYVTTGFSPDWSPEGNWIAFHDSTDGDNDIYVIRPDGTDRRALTDDDRDNTWPRWLPDGRHIIFARTPDEIWQVDLDGETAQVSRGQPPLDVSPDGLMLAYDENGILVIECLYKDYQPVANTGGKPRPEPDWPLDQPNEWELRFRLRFADRRELNWGPDSETVVYVNENTGKVYHSGEYSHDGLTFFEQPIGSSFNVAPGSQPVLQRDLTTVTYVGKSPLGLFEGIYHIEQDDWEYYTDGYDWEGE
jgi:hypothetical protein